MDLPAGGRATLINSRQLPPTSLQAGFSPEGLGGRGCSLTPHGRTNQGSISRSSGIDLRWFTHLKLGLLSASQPDYPLKVGQRIKIIKFKQAETDENNATDEPPE